jgi:hypothetical protein
MKFVSGQRKKADRGIREFDRHLADSLHGIDLPVVDLSQLEHLSREDRILVSRALPCDVPLGSHPGMYNLAEKYAKLGKGGTNPFIDPAGYKAELDLDEAMYRAVLEAQTKAAVRLP